MEPVRVASTSVMGSHQRWAVPLMLLRIFSALETKEQTKQV